MAPFRILAAIQDCASSFSHGPRATGTVGDLILEWRRRHDIRGPACAAFLAPWLARHALTDALNFFHCVAITDTLNVGRCLESVPSRRLLNRFRAEHAPSAVYANAAKIARVYKRREQGTGSQAYSAAETLEWLRFSSYVASSHSVHACLGAGSRILANGGLESAEDMMDRTNLLSRTSLLRARVRLDCVAMLLWRLLLESTAIDAIHINVYMDGSPQYRGQEMFASVLDVFIAEDGIEKPWLRRILLPLVNLGSACLDATGKTVCFLWQLLLMFGPVLLPAILGRIRCILTDNGTERPFRILQYYEAFVFRIAFDLTPPL